MASIIQRVVVTLILHKPLAIWMTHHQPPTIQFVFPKTIEWKYKLERSAYPEETKYVLKVILTFFLPFVREAGENQMWISCRQQFYVRERTW